MNEKNISPRIQIKLLQLIQDRGFKKRVVAFHARITPQRFSDILNGFKAPSELEKDAVAQFFGLTPTDLFLGSELVKK